MDFARVFQEFGAQRVADSAGTPAQSISAERAKGKGCGWLSTLNIFALRPVWQSGWVVAAIVLLAVGGFLWFQNVRLRRQMAETEARRIEIEQHAYR